MSNPPAENLTINRAIELALNHHQANRLAEAEQLYRKVLAVMPDHAVALHYLGVLAHQIGRNDDAVALMERSVALLPRGPYYSNLGEAYRALQKFDQAIASFKKAIELEPAGPSQHNNLALVYLDQNRLEPAEPLILHAIALSSTYAPAYNNLGTLRHRQGRFEEAEPALRKAMELDPRLGPAHANLANTLAALNRLDEALSHAQTAIQIVPNDAHAHLILAQIRLLQGDLPSGWPEYEWRVRKFPFLLRRYAEKPRWNGEPLAGKTILLHAEQGVGDTIQFARFIPMIAKKAARTIVECQPELVELIESISAERVTVIRTGESATSVPPAFDTYCSLVSLPGPLKTTLETIPADVPYLHVNESRVAAWRERVAGDDAKLRVGLVWAGNPQHEKDNERSATLRDLAPLAEVPDVVFYSLQKGASAKQLEQTPAGMRIINVAGDLHDFSDSAALMMNLDLIITVDTAAAHLAGALARPVWTLLAFVGEWRWLRGRDDTPWYPTMRLFRQERWGDWNGVAKRIADALSSLPRPD